MTSIDFKSEGNLLLLLSGTVGGQITVWDVINSEAIAQSAAPTSKPIYWALGTRANPADAAYNTAETCSTD